MMRPIRHRPVRHHWEQRGISLLLICLLIFPPTLFTPRTVRAALRDVSDTRLPAQADATYDVAVGDVDGDNDLDVVWVNDGQSRLLLNDGQGAFSAAPALQFPPLHGTFVAAALGDVNGDGAPDLLLANAAGSNYLLLNDGQGSFSVAPASNLPSPTQTSMDVQLGDVDHDGDLDLLVANWRSQNRLWLNDGSGRFVDVSGMRLPPEHDPTIALALADVDGDGALDLLQLNHGAPSRLLRNNGLGYFTEVSDTRLPLPANPYLDATFADLDRDGAADLLLAAGDDGIRLWRNDGGGQFTDVSAASLPTTDAFGIKVSVADLDGNGAPDVLLAAAGQDRVFLNQGSGTFLDATDAWLPTDDRRSFGTALFDAEGDLDPDLLLVAPDSGNRLLRNDIDFPRLRLDLEAAYIEMGDSISLHIKAFDEDGLSQATLTVTEPGGNARTTDLSLDLADGEASRPLTPAVAGVYTAVVTATDNAGNVGSGRLTFTVQQPDATPPELALSYNAPSPLLFGHNMTFQVTATDNQAIADTTLTVNGVSVPLTTNGSAMFTPTATGIYTATAQATDVAGNLATTSTTFSVAADTDAPAVQVDVEAALVDLLQPVAIRVAATDNVAVTETQLRLYGPATPDGMALTLNADGETVYTPFQPGVYTLTATAQDPSGNQGSHSTTFEAQGIADTTAPLVALSVEPATVALGNPVILTVSANDDVEVTVLSLEINDTPVSLATLPEIVYTPPIVGTYSAVLVARDAFGNTSSATATFRAVDPGSDSTPPLLTITAPAADSELSAPGAIIGTVQDETLVSYSLAYAPHGTQRFTTIASGDSEVFDGTLGHLDTSLLPNDLYDIRLSAVDFNGRTAATIVTYQVTGNLKVGNFTLAFQDLEIPVAGLPITINRLYNSRDKTVGDFGVGWRLQVQSTRLRENRLFGTGWEQGRPTLLTWCVRPSAAHYVAITLPDGRTETFDVVLSPACQTLFPVQETTVSFTPRPGTRSTLTALTDNVVAVVGSLDSSTYSPVELLHFDNGDDLAYYDPSRYQLTTPEGLRIDLDESFGVRTITEANGNTLTFDANGISHSAGKSVTFSRDAQGRISTITDPQGHTLHYAYDAAGDLVSTIDRAGHLGTYTYNNNHGLLLNQQAGQVMLHNVYDDDGRLLSTTNASGRTVTFAHDLDTRQEVVTDIDGGLTVIEYDTRGNIVRRTDPLGGVTRHTYDADDNQISTTNALGYTTSRTFDADGNKLSETDPLGNTTRWTYDEAGRVLSRTDPNDHTTTFTYDEAGNLLTRVNALGVTEATYTYDADGNRLTTTDAIGRVTTYTYDATGNLTATIDAQGNRHAYTYDANGDLIADTDPGGITVTTTNDSRGLFIEKLDSLGQAVRFAYDAFGQLTSIEDSDGRTTERLLDAQGNELQLTDPLGHTTSNTFNAKDQLIQSTDPLGRVTTHQYDILERLIKTIQPDGSFTATEYDPLGQPTKKIDANGNAWQFEYDAAGRKTRVIDPLGHATTLAYDAAGNVTREIDVQGSVTAFTYDAINRITRINLPDGSVESFVYDDVGRTISRTDGLGRTTQFTYDANDKITRVIDPAGNTTHATYNTVGQRLTQTDANGHTTRFDYDARGRLSRATYPDGTFETKQYDDNGNLTAVTQPNGQTLQFQYDVLRRLTAKIYPDGSRVDFTYTATGQLDTITDHRGVTRYTYDERDRLQGLTYPDGSMLHYTYDAVGNRTAVSTRLSPTADPQMTSYTYDDLNRPETVTDPDGNVTRYAYDAVGNRTRTGYPNGTAIHYTYDARYRLTMIEHRHGDTLLARYTYTLDASGDRTREEHLDGSSVDYQYDDLRRLIRETHRDTQGAIVHDWTYTYDAVGNRLSKTDELANLSTIYTYDVNDRLLAAGDVWFTYDDNGNTLSRTEVGSTTLYGYDFDNRLVQLRNPDGSLTTYSYDAGGNRIQKSDATDVVSYLVDPANNTGFAQVLVEYEPATHTPVVSYVYGDDLISQERAGALSLYHYDGSNHTRFLTDTPGTITDIYTFDAFGILLATDGNTPNHYLFNGEQFDPNSGFYYLRARYYAPEQGRFITRDLLMGHLADPPSLHKYLYAYANPITFADPSGLSSLAQSMLVSGLVNGLISAVIGGIQQKSFTDIVVDATINAGFGVLTAGVGGLAIKGLLSKMGSAIVKRNLVVLLIPLIKAVSQTVGFFLQALAQQAAGIEGARIPRADEGAMVFLAHMLLGMLALRADVNKIIQAAQSKVGLTRYTLKRLARANVSDMFEMVSQEGREGLKHFGISVQKFEDAALFVFKEVTAKLNLTSVLNASELLLDSIKALGENLSLLLLLKSIPDVDG